MNDGRHTQNPGNASFSDIEVVVETDKSTVRALSFFSFLSFVLS